MIPAPPTVLPTPAELGRIFVVGIGGSAMSAVARIAFERGLPVSGSDVKDSPVIEALRAQGVACHLGHDAAHVAEADTVIVSTAHREDIPEIAEALRRGLRVLHRSTATAVLAAGHRQIAVAGAHGKTSTCAMLATALLATGSDPSYLIGAVVPSLGTNAHDGADPDGDGLFIVEADESDRSFLQLSPTVAVVTNVDPDHLENFGDDPAAYHAAFDDFVEQIVDGGVLIACQDDPGAAALAARTRARGAAPDVLTYGRATEADVRMVEETPGPGGGYQIAGGPGDGARVELAVPGAHMALNSLAAHLALCCAGQDPAAAASGLAHYRGTVRRFELVGEAGGVVVFDDYGHHPTEMTATMRTARDFLAARPGRGRLVVVFRPLRHTRTQRLHRELGEALRIADVAVVLDPSGDEPIAGVTGESVAAAAASGPGAPEVRYRPTPDEAVATASSLLQPGDLLLTLGAGDAATLARRLLARLTEEGR